MKHKYYGYSDFARSYETPPGVVAQWLVSLEHTTSPHNTPAEVQRLSTQVTQNIRMKTTTAS